ncbi:MAG: L,D-transpeptidase [Calditrichaeota bacterium]|nr:L,D-transpeptidase [Calditrichota bacterium]MCB9367052.1 L,D-transpeptidase [Calditrichota bacterium]MCB9391464.1 L,D-transpeptidase [Calditrichota bacterium]
MIRVFLILVIIIGLLATIAFALSKSPPVLPPSPLIAQIDSVLAAAPEEQSLAKAVKQLRKDVTKSLPKGKYVVIDRNSNTAYLRSADSVMFKAVCSTGSGGELTDPKTGRKWVFHTPSGVFSIKNKIVEPWWRKPDWAFVEDDEPIPSNNADRLDPNVMGDYALGFGDGYFIHGTLYERLLGMSVSHGCVRLGSDDLKFIYDRVPIGTGVYVF